MQSQVQEKMKRYGLSDASRSWVLKALDPAAVGSASGIPDSSACCVMRPEYTVQASIPTPPGTTTSTWDCYMYVPPGDVNALVWAAAPSPADFSSLGAPLNAAFGNIQLQPDVNIPGPNFITVSSSGSLAYQQSGMYSPATLPATFRTQFRSVTVELSAPAVADQGDVYAAQYPLEIRSSILTLTPLLLAPSGFPYCYIADAVPLPMFETDLTLSSRMPYVGRARDGVYMPIRLMGPSQPFADTSYDGGVGQWKTGPGFAALPIVSANIPIPRALIPIQSDSGSPSQESWVSTGIRGVVLGLASFDTGYDNSGVGVIIWRGLSASSVGGGLPGATLMVKVVVGLEVCPRPTTPDRIYMKPPAIYDPRAIEVYYAVMSEMAPCYPARYNSLALLLPVISRVLSVLGGPLLAAGKAVVSEFFPKPTTPAVVYRPQASGATPLRARTRSRSKSAPISLKKRRVRVRLPKK